MVKYSHHFNSYKCHSMYHVSTQVAAASEHRRWKEMEKLSSMMRQEMAEEREKKKCE